MKRLLPILLLAATPALAEPCIGVSGERLTTYTIEHVTPETDALVEFGTQDGVRGEVVGLYLQDGITYALMRAPNQAYEADRLTLVGRACKTLPITTVMLDERQQTTGPAAQE